MGKFSPKNDMQKAFIRSTCDFIVAVGRVNSGKSTVVVARTAEKVRHKRGSGTLFMRRNDADFRVKDGLFDIHEKLFPLKTFGEKSKADAKDNVIGIFNKSVPAKITYINGYETHFKAIYDFDQSKIDAFFKGMQFDDAVIDEAHEFPWDVITYAGTRLRGGAGITRSIVLIQNPERDCDLRKICGCGATGGGWIGDDGYVIDEKNGKVRWFYNPNGDINTFYWGDTKEEVYTQCKTELDEAAKRFKVNPMSFILSMVFYDLPMITEDETYVARTQMSSASKAVAEGNWNYSKNDIRDNDIIGQILTPADLSPMFRQANDLTIDKVFMTVDMAGSVEDENRVSERRNDNMVCKLWNLNRHGLHCMDVMWWVNPEITEVSKHIRSSRDKHGLTDAQIVFDAEGLGSWLTNDFPRARRVTSNSAPSNIGKSKYTKLKYESMMIASRLIKDGLLTYAPELKYVQYDHSRMKSVRIKPTIFEHLGFECRGMILRNGNDNKIKGIPKEEMKAKYTRGFSLDLMDNVTLAVGAYIYQMYKLLSNAEIAGVAHNRTSEELEQEMYQPLQQRENKPQMRNISSIISRAIKW